MNTEFMRIDQDEWDWLSIRDRFSTLSDALEIPPDSHTDLASELVSIARWINKQEISLG